MNILGISGSLRKNAYNTQLLQVAARLLPESSRLEIIGIGDICLYNEDLDGEMTRIREWIRSGPFPLAVYCNNDDCGALLGLGARGCIHSDGLATEKAKEKSSLYQ